MNVNNNKVSSRANAKAREAFYPSTLTGGNRTLFWNVMSHFSGSTKRKMKQTNKKQKKKKTSKTLAMPSDHRMNVV